MDCNIYMLHSEKAGGGGGGGGGGLCAGGRNCGILQYLLSLIS